MKKVSGCIDVRALGCFNFEFFVEDSATEAEIKAKVDEACDYCVDYKVEEGYEPVVKTEYRKVY